MPYHVVRQGETLARVAERRRLAPSDIWDAPENSTLRELRGGEGHILRVGDLVFCPEPEPPHTESLDVSTQNRFQAVVPRVPLSIRIVHAGEAAAGEPFVAQAGAWRLEGTTDGDGRVVIDVPVTVAAVELSLPSIGLRYRVLVGALEPASELAGVQDRLLALGFYGGPSHGRLDEQTREGLRAFQRAHDLAVTGEPDDTTRSSLSEAFGC